MRRLLAWIAAILAVLGVLALGGVGWYYSSEILDVEQPDPPDRDIEVLAVQPRRVTLPATPDTELQGTWGLDAPEAYGQIGEIVRRDDDTITRRYEPIHGTLQPGDRVDVDGYAYPQDPDLAFDFPVSEVGLAGPLGEAPAWLVEGGSGDRWAVLVHGRAGRRNECFRLVAILHEKLDFNALCPSYRNDEGAPADPDGMYRQGWQEWRDIEPAVQYALDQGAKDLILVGFSMGGQITANLLRQSDLAAQVDGVIWDAPLLDWGPVIAAGARDREVPQWLVPIGMQASEWRAGVDYEDLNQIANAGEFDVPILLIHGTDDTTVPVSVANRFAAARPDIVTYERFRGAAHVRAWNLSPRRYARAVTRFIGGLD